VARTPDELADALADPDERNRALAELLRRGAAAVPGLLRALGHADVEVRAAAVEGLAEIADPSCADRFAGLITDPDDRIRSRAAYGLFRLGDPRAPDALVQTIDDNADVLRYPTTRSADALILMGVAALPRVGALLSAPSPLTRTRAQYILQNVVSAMPGEDWTARWRAFGSYVPTSADDQAREAAAAAWRAWIATLGAP
jgi:HEAT repeat protein